MYILHFLDLHILKVNKTHLILDSNVFQHTLLHINAWFVLFLAPVTILSNAVLIIKTIIFSHIAYINDSSTRFPIYKRMSIPLKNTLTHTLITNITKISNYKCNDHLLYTVKL